MDNCKCQSTHVANIQEVFLEEPYFANGHNNYFTTCNFSIKYNSRDTVQVINIIKWFAGIPLDNKEL